MHLSVNRRQHLPLLLRHQKKNFSNGRRKIKPQSIKEALNGLFQVLVKTLKEGSTAEEIETLCQDGSLIFNLRHQNLMSLVGMSFAPKAPPFLIYPAPGGINLRTYVNICTGYEERFILPEFLYLFLIIYLYRIENWRIHFKGVYFLSCRYLNQTNRPFKVLDLVDIYLQIARGLHFMHANNILHTDVAARNCM